MIINKKLMFSFEDTISNNDQNVNNNQNSNNIQKSIKNKNAKNLNTTPIVERNQNKKESKREMIKPLENPNQLKEDHLKENKKLEENNKNKKTRRIIIYILIALFFILSLVLFLNIFFNRCYIPKKNNPILKISNSLDSKEKKNEAKTEYDKKVEIAMEAFKPIFKINTKKGQLNQILFKSYKNYFSFSEGKKSLYSIFTKSKYDIYIFNESLSDNKNKNFYNMKYTSIITINSFCINSLSNSSDNECELQKYLDLNVKNSNSNPNNLRRNEDSNKDKIKEVLLPICIIEHTDTNIILSLTCPKNLPKNMKKDIILAFKNIKPNSNKGITDKDNKIDDFTIEEKDDKKYIKSYSKDCINHKGNQTKNFKFQMDREIITDKEGNLIFSKTILIKENINDTKKNFTNFTINYTNIFEDISKQNKEVNSNNYKFNLDIILDLTKSLMIKETFNSENTFKELLKELINGNENNTKLNNNDFYKINNKRNLYDYFSKIQSVFENNYFLESLYDIIIKLNLKNDIGLHGNFRAISEMKIGNDILQITNSEISSNLGELLKKYIYLPRAENKLAITLYDQINLLLLELKDKIKANINELYNFVIFKEYLKEYSIELLENKINLINDNITNYFNEINKYLINYGTTKEKYESNLENIFEDLSKRERLDNLINDNNNNIDKLFLKLEKNSLDNKEFIQYMTLFSNFEDKINTYIKNLNEQYIISKTMIKKNDDELKEKIFKIYEERLNFYNKANISFHKIEESIINSTLKISDLIQSAKNVTYEVIKEKYIEIKNNFNPINKIINNNKKSLNISYHYLIDNDNNEFIIENNLGDYIYENKFLLDIVYENEDIKKPKILGKIINKIKKYNYEMNFYSRFGSCGKVGQIIEIYFNNISLSTDMIFDWNSNKLKFVNNYDSDEYRIYKHYYETKEEIFTFKIGGINVNKIICPTTVLMDDFSSELYSSKKYNKIEEYLI